MINPLYLWFLVFIDWTLFIASPLNYWTLIFTVLTAAITFGYNIAYRVMRKA